MNGNDFLEWLKAIEIDEINGKFDTTINNFNTFKKIYIDNEDFVENKRTDSYVNELMKKINKEDRKEIKSNIKNMDIFLESLNLQERKKLDWLSRIDDIENFYSDKSMHYNKMWKFKILYFLYAGYINIKEKTNKQIPNAYARNIDDDFFNDKVQWYAFKNGPITNHYNYLGEDHYIFINFINKNTEDFLKSCFLMLKNFSLNILIYESHETKPYKDNWHEDSYWSKIPTEEIIEFFRKNEPFYFKFFDESTINNEKNEQKK